jgi:aryl-alcohol dehydrogenase-like predicted oxidoreductase
MSRLAIAWCLKNPHVSTVILGASKTTQLTENLTAFQVVPMLTDEVMQRIDTIMGNKPVLPEY